MLSPEQVRRYPLFAGIDPVVYNDLAMLGDEVSFEAGQWIFEEGVEADRLYFVASGKVDLFIDMDEEGEKKQYVSTHIEGEMLGWSALVEPFIFTLSAKATEATTLAMMDGPALRRFLNSNPEMGVKIMGRLSKIVSDRLTDLRVRFVSMVV